MADFELTFQPVAYLLAENLLRKTIQVCGCFVTLSPWVHVHYKPVCFLKLGLGSRVSVGQG